MSASSPDVTELKQLTPGFQIHQTSFFQPAILHCTIIKTLTINFKLDSLDETSDRSLSVFHDQVTVVNSSIINIHVLQHQRTVALKQLLLRNVHTALISFTLV